MLLSHGGSWSHWHEICVSGRKKARSHTPLQLPRYWVCVCLVCSVQLFNLPLKISTKFQVHFLLWSLHICSLDLHNTLLPFRQHISMPAEVLSFLWRALQHSFLSINPGLGCRVAVLAGKPRLLFSAQTLPTALLRETLRRSQASWETQSPQRSSGLPLSRSN